MARDVPDAAPLTAQISGEILDVPLALIQVGDRQRPVDPVWAAALGRVMTVEGQGPGRNRDPIWICRLPGRSDYLLVAGGHRMEGARLEDWATIRAILVSADAAERRQAEISENLWRKTYDPIDRASAIAEMIDLQKVAAGVALGQSGQSVAAQARWAPTLKADAGDAIDTMSIAYGWSAEVAEHAGFTRRTIYRDLELHRGLRPDVIAKLRHHPVAKNAAQLRALARLNEDDQRAVAGMIAEGAAKSVADAQAIRHQTPKAKDLDDQEKFYLRQITLWGRLSAKTKALAFAQIFARDPTLPAHLKALLSGLTSGEGHEDALDGPHPSSAGGLVQSARRGKLVLSSTTGGSLPVESGPVDAAGTSARSDRGNSAPARSNRASEPAKGNAR